LVRLLRKSRKIIGLDALSSPFAQVLQLFIGILELKGFGPPRSSSVFNFTC